jgi:hypothetical protein
MGDEERSEPDGTVLRGRPQHRSQRRSARDRTRSAAACKWLSEIREGTSDPDLDDRKPEVSDEGVAAIRGQSRSDYGSIGSKGLSR